MRVVLLQCSEHPFCAVCAYCCSIVHEFFSSYWEGDSVINIMTSSGASHRIQPHLHLQQNPQLIHSLRYNEEMRLIQIFNDKFVSVCLVELQDELFACCVAV